MDRVNVIGGRQAATKSRLSMVLLTMLIGLGGGHRALADSTDAATPAASGSSRPVSSSARPVSSNSGLANLVRLSSERLALADAVAVSKFHTGKAVEDPQRIQQQLQALVEESKQYALEPQKVKAFFSAQIEANQLVQYNLLDTYAMTPDLVGPADDLETIRQDITRINQQILSIFGAAEAELKQGDCAVKLHEAIAFQANDSDFDDLHSMALVRAFGDICRQP